jgi:two-component system chemotaxis sensor kinase CheA
VFNDNEQFIQQFLIEAKEHFESIEDNLIFLEKNFHPKEFNSEYVNELFRSIHTIKGLSGMLEFDNLFNLTHIWENLLDQVRKKEQDLSKDIINTSFKGLDVLNKIIESIKDSGNDLSVSVTSVLLELENLSKLSESLIDTSENDINIIELFSEPIKNTINDYEKSKLLNEIESGKNIYEISLFLNKDCFDKDISYISTCINLEFLGEIINISPNMLSVPDLNDFNPENFDLEIYIAFSTDKDEDRIFNILKNRDIKLKRIFNDNKEIPENYVIESQEKNNIKENIDIDSVKTKKAHEIKQRHSKVLAQDTIRVETSRLDTLLSLLGEQVISKTQLEHISSNLGFLINENEEELIPKELILGIHDKLNEKISTLSRLSNEIQNTVMRIRMLPIGNVFNRFTRVVRDIAKDLGKEVDLVIHGEETELDKTIIEEISDPLMHIIRNAIDHGLESPSERISRGKESYGTLNLNAYQQGNSIVIVIKDDGKGLNLESIKRKAIEKGLINTDTELSENEIINLIFQPGFSTAEQVTGISGRGVGMDVVKTNISNLKGSIEIQTKENEGTTFIIKLPLTLAIIQSLLIEINEITYAIPLNSVVESYRATKEEIRLVNNKPVLKLRDKVLPILYFQDHFKLQKIESDREFLYIVIIGVAEHKVGFIVDRLVGQKEIVIKPLNDPLVKIKGIGGATLIGEDIILIIDTVPIVLESQSLKRY